MGGGYGGGRSGTPTFAHFTTSRARRAAARAPRTRAWLLLTGARDRPARETDRRARTTMASATTASSSSGWAAEFSEPPAVLPRELEDVYAGSWAYFYRNHGGGLGDDGDADQGPSASAPSASSSSSSASAAPIGPRSVFVRFFVHDIKEVNEVAGTVHVDFSVQLNWVDPVVAAAVRRSNEGIHSDDAAAAAAASAAAAAGVPSTPVRGRLQRAGAPSSASSSAPTRFWPSSSDLAHLWLPTITVGNAADMLPLHESSSCVRMRDGGRGGRIEMRLRWRGLINNRMDLRCFPFDSDLLLLTLSSGFPAAHVRLVPDPLFDASTTHVRHSLTEWELEGAPTVVTGASGAAGDSIAGSQELEDSGIHASAGPENMSPSVKRVADGAASGADPAAAAASAAAADAALDTFSTCHLVLKVHRNPFFYLWKMVAIQELIAVWSWTVFYHDVEDLGGRMSTTLTLFLSSVAFLHVINDRLPKLPYLTVMDKFTYASFFLLFLTAYENLFAFYASHHMDDRLLAQTVDLISRFAFPMMHFASCAFLAIQVKNSRRTELDLGNEL
jgi:hypothetical protein